MNEQLDRATNREQQLVKLYQELTGATEATARNVFMYVCAPESAPAQPRHSLVLTPTAQEEPEPTLNPAPVRPIRKVVGLAAACLCLTLTARGQTPAPDQTNSFITSPLSLADAVNLALRQNPTVMRAQKDFQAAQGVVIQTRAVALPTVTVGDSYQAVQRTDIDFFSTPGFSFGTPQNWDSQIKLIQSLYAGGRLLSGVRSARLIKEQSLLNYQTAVANAVLEVQVAYYDVLLNAEQIVVQEASVELLTRQLADNTRRYEAGTVPRFNVLQAEVALANQRPNLIRARNNYRVSKNNLATLLGFNVPHEMVEDIPLKLSGKLDAQPFDLPLSKALTIALERRTELGSLRKSRALRHEDVITAKAGYKPLVQGFLGYDVHNSTLSQDLTREDHGWIAGAQLSWNLFDGLRTQGAIKQATANYERAGVELDDTTRRIELEVRTDYSIFIEAREVLESQKKVLEQAEEALRLASARYEAGTGTQLDVLSAQTALTDARSTNVQALHDYDTALARLQRAIGLNVPTEAPPQN